MRHIDDLPPPTAQRVASAGAGLAAIVVGLLIAVGSGSLRVAHDAPRAAVPAGPLDVHVLVPIPVADMPPLDGVEGEPPGATQ